MDSQPDPWTPDISEDVGGASWLSASAAAATLGVNQRTIRRAIASGKLPASKRNGVYRIAPDDLATYRARRQLGNTKIRALPASPWACAPSRRLRPI